jgi:polysaccharide pyruvyl transferase WcaK-like protein
MGFCDPRIWPRKDDAAYQRYLDKAAAFVSWLLEQNYCVEVFTSEISVDHYAITDLQERLTKSRLPHEVSKVSYRPVMSLNELLAQMSEFDFIVTSKFHGVIFSHLLARPVIALSYHHKIDDLMRAVGHDRYCLDIEHFDIESLKDTFKALVNNSDGLSTRFRRTTASYGAAVQQQFDELFALGKS